MAVSRFALEAKSDIYIRDQHVVNTLGARVIALQNELMKVLWLRYAEVPFPSPSTTRPQTFKMENKTFYNTPADQKENMFSAEFAQCAQMSLFVL